MVRHNSAVPQTASRLLHLTSVHLWCIRSCDSQMDTDLAATCQMSPVPVIQTLRRDCVTLNTSLVQVFFGFEPRGCVRIRNEMPWRNNPECPQFGHFVRQQVLGSALIGAMTDKFLQNCPNSGTHESMSCCLLNCVLNHFVLYS